MLPLVARTLFNQVVLCFPDFTQIVRCFQLDFHWVWLEKCTDGRRKLKGDY